MSFRAFHFALIGALALCACNWTSDTTLMPRSDIVAPILQDEDIYGFNGSDDEEILEVAIQNARTFIRYTDVRENSDPVVLLTSFDALGGNWYIAQVEACIDRSEIVRARCTGDIGYFLVRRTVEGIDLYRPDGRCSADALVVGARQQRNTCVFTAYSQVLSAFRAKAREADNGLLYLRPYSTIN